MARTSGGRSGGRGGGRQRGGNPRLEEKVRQDIATIVNYKLNDPRVEMVTITRVELFDDNTIGDVYFSIVDGSDADKRTVQRALDHARGHVQRLLGRSLKTRNTPRLRFIYDQGIEKQVHISALLRDLENERREVAGLPPVGRDAADPEDDEYEWVEVEVDEDGNPLDPDVELAPADTADTADTADAADQDADDPGDPEQREEARA